MPNMGEASVYEQQGRDSLAKCQDPEDLRSQSDYAGSGKAGSAPMKMTYRAVGQLYADDSGGKVANALGQKRAEPFV